MQGKITLYSLFENTRHSASRIIYCDGIKQHSITYKDLQNHVTFISGLLENLLLSNSFICCFMKPSLSLPAIILGVLKVSSTFAFLDVHKPLESLISFQNYLEIKTLLIEDCYLNLIASKLCHCWEKIQQFYVLSDFIVLQCTSKCENNACPNSKEFKKCDWQREIAYVIQTSGTTGEPKIVQVPHDCITPNIVDLKSRFSVTTDDVILQSTRMTFDPSVIEIFLSLSTGATLVIIADSIRSMPKRLIEVIVNSKVTIFQGTPSLICSLGEKVLKEHLLHEDSSLRILAFGGEMSPSTNKLQRWKSERNRTEIYNLYGLTEISCWATCFKINVFRGDLLSGVPIGEPLLNTSIEIRSSDGGITDKGELFIGGYNRFCIINNEDWPKDSECFMRSTGDLVNKTPDGLIYFEGRNDCIIKYMGHKISLQCINDIIEKFEEVKNHFLHFDSSSKKLYLFVVLSTKTYFKSEIENKLLKSMKKSVPNLPVLIIVEIPFIPLTNHGKADVKRLMSHVNEKEKKGIYYEGNSEIEKWDDIISGLWKNFTNQNSIEETDTFVLKGGNSIYAVQFAAEVEWHFQLSLPLLVEKILNESYKDIIHYVDINIKDNLSNHCKEVHSNIPETITEPPLKKMCCGKSQCFAVCSKHQYFAFCIHSKDSKSCFTKEVEDPGSIDIHLKLIFKWDLKKCIDATSCILHLPLSEQLLVFIGSHFGIFSCIDIDKQSEKWQILVPDRIESSACVSACGSYVLFGCYDCHLYCIDIASGNIKWKHKTGAEVKTSPSVSLDNTVFVGSHDKHIYAIDVESGFLLWKKQISHGSIFSSPTVIPALLAICVGTLDGVLALLKMESGNILWSLNFEKPFFSSPLITSNRIFIGSTDKCMLSLDFNGKIISKYSTDEPVFSSAAYHKDFDKNTVVFGCHDSYIHCITSNGNMVWRTLLDSAIYATPFIFKKNIHCYVCVASSKGIIYVLQASDGKIITSWTCPKEIFSSPIILDDILVIGCRDNNIYCFNLINDVF